jgi:hypothetical protein
MAKESTWTDIDRTGKWKHTRFDPRMMDHAAKNTPAPDPWARKLVSLSKHYVHLKLTFV